MVAPADQPGVQVGYIPCRVHTLDQTPAYILTRLHHDITYDHLLRRCQPVHLHQPGLQGIGTEDGNQRGSLEGDVRSELVVLDIADRLETVDKGERNHKTSRAHGHAGNGRRLDKGEKAGVPAVATEGASGQKEFKLRPVITTWSRLFGQAVLSGSAMLQSLLPCC